MICRRHCHSKNSEKFQSIFCKRMQAAQRIIETWCTENFLLVNSIQTEKVLFTKNRKMDQMKTSKLLNVLLTLSDSVKDLGVVFSRKMIQARICMSMCKKLQRSADRAVLLSYGAIVLWPRFTGAIKTTSTAVLETLYGFLPLDIYVREWAFKRNQV